jgi:hypothetical protein
MSIYITEIEKHRFVCGLFWQSLSRPRELMKEAAALAKKIDFDLMVLRKDNATAQAGFAQSKEGARKKLYSLGAAVSKSLAVEGAFYDGQKQRVHNWLGAFKLPDGKWAYFAVRDSNFLPNGDFAGTKEEVLERLHGDYGLGGWNAVIGDAELEELGFHNFNAKRIEDLLPHTRAGKIKIYGWWGLRPVAVKLPLLPVALCSLALVVGIGGAVYWMQYQKKKEEEERDRRIEAARREMMGHAAPSGLPHPWASKPAPLLTAQTCLNRLVHITPGGWKLDEYSCTPAQLSYSWSRQDSAIELLLGQVPQAIVDMSGDKATYSEPLALASGKDEVLLEQKKLLEPVISRLQLMNLSPKISLVPPPPPPPGQNNGQAVPQPDWKTFNFTMQAGGLHPTEVASILSRPGIRIDKLIYRGSAWTIEGVMYAK